MATPGAMVCLLGIFQALAGGGPPLVKPADLAAIHSVGVISALGDKAEIKRIGFTVFSNSVTYLPIADWTLDDVVENEAKTILSTRYSVTLEPADRAAFSGLHVDFFKGEGAAVSATVLALPPAPVDAYLVILPESAQQDSGPRGISGLGVYQERGSTMIHAVYSVYLVDAKSGKVLGWRWGNNALGDKPPSLFSQGPYRPFPYTFDGSLPQIDKAETMTSDQKHIVDEQLIYVLKDSLDYTLTKLGVTDAPPPPAK